MSRIFPIILSGGSGTRLWPLSRAKYPKQFIRFSDNQELSFLQAASLRLPEKDGFEAPTYLCNEEHRFLVREQTEDIGIAPRGILLEPVARNTAPAITVAALSAVDEDPDAIIVVMPSDHVIEHPERFGEAVGAAAKVAAKGNFVLFGIEATSPHTGYGYIRKGKSLGAGKTKACKVEGFFEKPDEKTAQRYLREGGTFWNSGIFVLPAGAFLEEVGRLEPDILAACEEAYAAARRDLDFLRLDKTSFMTSPSVSVDVAVMERTKAAAVLPLDAGWSDVGSWSSLLELAERDENGNAIVGDAILEDVHNCYIRSNRSVVSAVGVKDLIIVDTPDAILVSEAGRSQDVPRIVERIAKTNRNEHEQHVREYRPWGYFETLNAGPRFQVKLLHVKPKAKLSLQMHHHRSEHWVVVKGTALVVRGEERKLVCENESFYISATEWHRLENPGKVPVEIIEVQIGTYLGEDDIVRREDVYNRAAE